MAAHNWKMSILRDGLQALPETVFSDFPAAGVAELADALDSKSSDRKIVWVRAPPPASFIERWAFSLRPIRLRSGRGSSPSAGIDGERDAAGNNKALPVVITRHL